MHLAVIIGGFVFIMPQRQGKGHKGNNICPVLKCNYSSRQFLREQSKITEQNTVSSKHCPIHQQPLVFINSRHIPKPDSKEKQELLKLFKND